MNEWTMEEIMKLKANWTSPPDLKKLREILGRSSASIYDKARKLELPKLSMKETLAIKKKDTIADQKIVFVEAFLQCRFERQALRQAAVAYRTVHEWMDTDPDFKSKYDEAKKLVASTKRCVYCGLVGPKDLFRKEYGPRSRNQWKTGICQKCDSKRIMGKNVKTLEAKLNSLWKSCKRAVSGRQSGRNTPQECTISPDDLIRLHNLQDGRCHYTGLPMVHQGSKVRDPGIISVDRKNPKSGYTLDNIVLCCWGANQLKRDLPYDEFIKFCKLIANRFPD